MKRLLIVVIVASMAGGCGSGSPASDGTNTPASTTTTLPGDSTELNLIVLPGPDGLLPADISVGCLTGPYFPAASLNSVTPIDGAGYEFVVEAIEPFLSSEEGQFWPQEDWQVLHETDDEVLIVHVEPVEVPGISFMTIAREGDGWRWAGSSMRSDCELTTRIPSGLNRVEWRLDPASPLDSAATIINVLATELECASGQPMGERLLDPEVVITAEAVFLAFAAQPDGEEYHNCQGNPEQRVSVELPEPLGDRDVRDGLRVGGFLSDYLGAAGS
jgi:hypothetical protein